MSSVKHRGFALCALAGSALLFAGCSNVNWARLAPPGIIKYEEIAAEKPPNPAIAAELDRRANNADAEFPILSQTPAAGRAPRRDLTRAEIGEETRDLEETRDRIEAELTAERIAAKADRQAAEALEAERLRLEDQVSRDAAVARRERATPMPVSPDEERKGE